MNTRQLVEDETERGTPEAPWRSQKRKRTSSWYQRPPDAITSRVWSVVNRPLVQPLSLPYVTASRRSLSLSPPRSFVLFTIREPLSLCLSPQSSQVPPTSSTPPSFPIQSAQLSKSLPNKRRGGGGYSKYRPWNFPSQIEWGGIDRSPMMIGRIPGEGDSLWEWMLLLSTREGNSNSLEEGDQRCSFCASCFVVLYIYYIKNYILENVCFYCYEFWIGWLYFYWFNKDILLFYRQVSSFFLLR